jgi:hypothetical protein
LYTCPRLDTPQPQACDPKSLREICHADHRIPRGLTSDIQRSIFRTDLGDYLTSINSEGHHSSQTSQTALPLRERLSIQSIPPSDLCSGRKAPLPTCRCSHFRRRYLSHHGRQGQGRNLCLPHSAAAVFPTIAIAMLVAAAAAPPL